MLNILSQKIQEKISSIATDSEIFFVVKGLPLNLVEKNFAEKNFAEDIETAAKSPRKYFNSLLDSERKFATYEEFILLKNFFTAEFEDIYILNNNLYADQFPIETKFTAATKNNLLEHFTEPETETGDDVPEIKTGKCGNIFTGLREHNNILIGVYNDEDILDDVQIKILNLFESATENFSEVEEENATDIFDIADETDFVCLVKKVLTDSPPEIFVRLQNCIGDTEKISNHLKLLQKNFSAKCTIYLVKPKNFQQGFESREDYLNILQKYWGADKNFRSFTVYDLDNLEEKKTFQVSQEQIISDIVREVEIGESGIGRDIFVTAPTGAGKSIIFQLPAIYLAEKYNLMTLVISPLIGLMNDQVQNLEIHNYNFSATINSDIAPPLKEKIIDEVAKGDCHILYISPETLLSRSDIEQLIGDREIGMVVIDEAHIVTTWGKQFRPDYWYLGDHIRRLRKIQHDRKGRSFTIATFTATAIFGGVEDMYKETVESLHLLEPITYLGYIKRNDIDIEIDTTEFEKGERAEYGIEKYPDIVKAIKRAEITNQKTLIYFPEVSKIEKMYDLLKYTGKAETVTIYHGQLNKEDKNENYLKFRAGEKLVMLATKAFGMGIDINDIKIVMHFAPTGNVCDYVQEIGRAARDKNLRGEALYHYDKKDFKYINRLHGLSAIKKYQLIAVVKKIYEIFSQQKKNNLLLDAENFTYIFDKNGDEDSSVNKVKTALLMIQRDFESRLGFSPLTVRPIPLFAEGFFVISPFTQKELNANYENCCLEIDSSKRVCKVNLKNIWRKNYQDKSFPQFKYFLYSGKDDFDFNQNYPLKPALSVTINFKNNYKTIFNSRWELFKSIIKKLISEGKKTSIEDLIKTFCNSSKISKYKAQNLCEILIASMINYQKNFSRSSKPFIYPRILPNGNKIYYFSVSSDSYFQTVEKIFWQLVGEVQSYGEEIFLTDARGDETKKIAMVLGILEAMEVLEFKMSGGASSQIYIHISQIRNLKNILDRRDNYHNRILETVAQRHKMSVKMLTYIYEGNFDNAEIWNLLENYFLGKIPDEVLQNN